MASPSLSLDILLQIFAYLADDLVACTCVCREWQAAAEKFTFADLHINSSNLEDFRRIVASSNYGWRTFYVRKLHFKVILPEYDVAARAQYETQDDRDGNNNVFTQSVTTLFDILSSWPDEDDWPQMSLQIYARSPSDWEAEPDWETRKARKQTGYLFPEQELLGSRYHSSYLQLAGDEDLPSAKCITSLTVSGCGSYRNIAPIAVSQMLTSLPRLGDADLNISDNERNDAVLRDSLRNDFSTAHWPLSLRNLMLAYEGRPPFDETYPSPKRSAPGTDLLCIALHQLSQQLETLDLYRMMIGPELFWPESANKTPPSWPVLKTFYVSFVPATPCGTWLFDSNPSWETDSPPLSPNTAIEPPCDRRHNRFRRLPNKHLLELYLAAGRAAQHMPRLTTMDLEAELVEGGLHSFVYEADSGIAKWFICSEFGVSERVHEAWDAVAQLHGHAQASVENGPEKKDSDESVQDVLSSADDEEKAEEEEK